MNSTPASSQRSIALAFSRRLWLCACAALALPFAFGAEAESTTIGSPVTEPPAPPALPYAGVLAAAPRATPLSTASPLRWGPLLLRPHVFYRLLHGDGVQAAPGEQLTTTVQTFSPGLLLELGPRWSLDYTLARTWYSNEAFQDATDHSAFIAGNLGTEDFKLGLSQSFASTTTPLVETGQPTSQDIYATSLKADIQLGGNFWLGLGAAHTTQRVENFSDSQEWSTMDWVHYRLPADLDVAVGLGGGIVEVSEGPDMDYVRFETRLGWRPGTKLVFDAELGVEHRTFSRDDSPDRTNPILKVSARYQPFMPTVIVLSADRTVTTSYFADQIVEGSRIAADWEQRLFQRFYLDTSYSYMKADYVATTRGAVAGRNDSVRMLNLRLRTVLFERGTVAIFYQRTTNSSNEADFAFASDQVGLELGYRF